MFSSALCNASGKKAGVAWMKGHFLPLTNLDKVLIV